MSIRNVVLKLAALSGSFIIVACFLLMLVIGDGVVNNGDWGRVTQYGGFFPVGGQSLEASYLIAKEPMIGHSTTMGVLIGGLGMAHGLFSSPYFFPVTSHLVLVLIFGIGLVLIVFDENIGCRHLLGFSLLWVYIGYGFYLKSFYEEAVVLALLPWLCLGFVDLIRRRRYIIFLIAASLMVYSKLQMVFVAPLFLLVLYVAFRDAKDVRFIASCLVIIVVAILSFNSVHHQNDHPNAYNRFYNGIGWSLLDSGSWRATHFNWRHASFYRNKAALQEKLPDDEHRALFGTSYYPTGEEMAARADREASKGDGGTIDRDLFARAIDRGRLASYVGYFIDNPGFISKFLSNIYVMTYRSNYSLDYLRVKVESIYSLDSMGAAKNFVLKQWVVVTLVIFLLAWALSPSGISAVAMAWLMLSPIFVVVGDGFYEFEKHMIPYMILVPALLAMQCARRDHRKKKI